MRKYILLISIILLSVSVLSAAEGKKYGTELTLTEKTKVSDILAEPDKYEGQKVQIEGLVVNVCEKRGCWIEVASDKPYESIRVKVKDGDIVFPMEAKGEKAVVEGEVYSFEVEQETECSGCSSHDHAKDVNEKSEADACCSKEKQTKKVYQIKGLGAVI